MQKTERSRKVIAVFSVANFAGRGYLSGIYRYAREHGFWDVMQVNETYAYISDKADYKTADGIITLTKSPFRTAVGDRRIPMVFLDSTGAQSDRTSSLVSHDRSLPGKVVAEYLLGKRLGSFAFLRFSDLVWAKAREEAFVRTIHAGGGTASVFEPRTGNGWNEEKSRIVEWLRKLPKPCGLMVAYDGWGQVVLDLARSVGIKIPDELCVVGVDNDVSICESTVPTLSSCAVDFAEQGYRAAELLDDIVSGRVKGAVHRAIDTSGRVVERMSSNYVPRTHYCAVKARELIRTRLLNGITISEIVRITNVSRRLLELRFKEHYGHTLNDEFHDARIDLVKAYLKTSTLSVTDICSLCGYRKIDYMQRLFKAATGMSMREWRER